MLRSTGAGGGRRRFGLAGAVVLVAVVLAAWLLRLPRGPDADALNVDVNLYFYPLYDATYGRLAAGRLPTWNPYQLCGIPWLATLQAGTFYPGHALYLVLPLHLGLAASNALHLTLAALATAAFARRAGLSGAAALLAAFLFTLRGLFALSLAAPNYVEAAAWLPVGAWAVLDLVAGRFRRGGVVLAASAALSLLAGYPQPTAYVLIAWTTLAAAATIGAGAAPRRAVAIGVAFATALGVGALAAAVQLVPTLELLADGAHRDLTPEAMAPFGVSLAAGILATTGIAGSAFSWGAAALALGAAAVASRRRRWLAWWALGLAALGIVFALGDSTPLFRLYRAVPFLGSFRFPDRILGLVDFAFAIAAATGLDALAASGQNGMRVRAARMLALATLVAVVGLAWTGWVPDAQRWPVTAFAAVAVLLVVGAASGRPVGRMAAPGLVAVAALEAVLAPWKHLVTYSPDVVRRWDRHAARYREVAERVGSQRAWFAGTGLAGLRPEHALKLVTRHGVRTIDDYEPLAPRRQGQYLTYLGEGSPTFHRPPWLFAGDIPTLVSPPGVAPASTRRRLLDLAAVRVVVAPAPILPELATFLRDAGLGPGQPLGDALVLFENPHALPRAFVTYRTRPALEADALLAALADPGFDPVVESYVEGPPGFEPASDAPPRGSPARIVVDEEDVVEVEAMLERPGLVVLADAYYPGWRATVDGVAAPIVPTNHLFRGVPAPAGTHLIRFEYGPTSIAAGVAGSVLGWLLMGVAAVWPKAAAASPPCP